MNVGEPLVRYCKSVPDSWSELTITEGLGQLGPPHDRRGRLSDAAAGSLADRGVGDWGVGVGGVAGGCILAARLELKLSRSPTP